MKVILVCGNYTENPEHPALAEVDGRSALDWQIQRILYLGFEPVTVVTGPESEDILRSSRLVEYSELVFDTNDPQKMMSHIRSGLYVTKDIAFVLPIHILAPQSKVWQKMRVRSGQITNDVDLIRPYTPSNGQVLAGYPWLITRTGNELIKSGAESPLLTDLTEDRLVVMDSTILSGGLILPPVDTQPEPTVS